MLAMTRPTRRVQQMGVTLLELAIVMTIVGILAVVAVPSIVDRWQRATVILLAEQFASAVSLARATAQYQHVQVHLRPQHGLADWSAGWEVVSSPPADTPDKTSKPTQEILWSTSPAIPPTVHITSNFPDDTFSFAPVGYSRTSNGAFLSGTLTITSGRHTRSVTINDVGRARICDPSTNTNCTATGDTP